MPRIQDALKRRLLAVPEWALGGLALALRLAYALRQGGRFYQIDELSYDAGAWNLASRGFIGVGDAPGILPPVPVAFSAAFYALFGHDMLFPRLGLACVGAATAWMIGRMTRELSRSEAAGRAAFALAAVYPFFVYYGGVILSETFYLFFVVPGIWLLCAPDERARATRPALAGLCLAFAGLSRIEAVPITLLIWGWLAASCLLRRARWKDLALAAACWALPLLLWAGRNQAQTGRFTLDDHGGITILVGTVAYEVAERMDTADAVKLLETMPFYAQAQKLPPEQRDAFYQRTAFAFMSEHPGQTVVQWAKKLVSFWRFYPRVDKVYYESDISRPGAGLGRWQLVALSLLFEPWLILGGFAGFWALRSRWRELAPMALFILGTMGIHIIVVSMMRYRLPVMPFLMFAVCALAAGAPARTRR